MQVATGNFEKIEVHFIAKQMHSNFSKLRMDTCSEVLADMSRVVDDRTLLCGMWSKSEEDCII